MAASLGPFQLQERLGLGSTATVYRGRHRQDGTPVALKILKTEYAAQPELAAQWHFEVRAAAQLNHPRITGVYDHGRVTSSEARGQALPEGACWLAMELVDGGSAVPLVGKVGWRSLRGVLLGILDGLAHAHARGVIHRDIKPANVLLQAGTRAAKLTDFGLAHTVSGEASPTDDQFAGTPSYMAPEQIHVRWRDFGPWTDLYAVGATAWAFATGSAPYTGDITNILASHLSGFLPDFEPVVPVPDGFESWLQRLMAHRPAERYRVAADAAWGLVQLGEPQQSRPDLELGGSTVRMEAIDWEEVAAPKAKSRRWWKPWSSGGQEEREVVEAEVRPPPLPPSWRGQTVTTRHMDGAGLALFGQRALGLVGRIEERDRLWRELHAMHADRAARIVLIEGAAGSGKTALAEWMMHRAAEVGAGLPLSLSHSAVEGPGDGLGGLLAREFRAGGLEREELVQRFQKQLGRMGFEDRSDVLALAELAHPSTDDELARGLGARLSGPAERHAAGVRYLGARAAERPLVLLVDDLHHSADSQAFLAALLESQEHAPTPVLALVTARSEAMAADPERARSLRELAGDAAFELEPLGREESANLVRDLLGLEAKLAARVEERAAGNPLFAVQLVGDWVERGLLEPGPHGYRLAEGAAADFPEDLLGVWQARLDGLLGDEGGGEALELAAVLGQQVRADDWAAVVAAAGVDPERSVLDEMFRFRLASPALDSADWSFAHGMLREALEARARDAGRLARWSSLCADVLVGQPDSAARRARLLLATDRREEAVDQLFDAVRDQLVAGEFLRAVELQHLRRTALEELGVGAMDPRRVRSNILDSQILRQRGEIDRAGRVATQSLIQARLCGDDELLTEALVAAGNAEIAAGEIEEARELLTEARDLAEAGGRSGLLATVSNHLAFVSQRAGRLDDARLAFRQAIFRGEAAGTPSAVAAGYRGLSRVALQTDDPERARFYLEEARIRFEALGARGGAASCAITLGEILRVTGDLAGAELAYREAAERLEACGSGDMFFARLNLAMTVAERGRYEPSLQQLRVLEKELVRFGRAGMLGALRAAMLLPLAGLARWDELDETFAKADEGLMISGVVDLDIARMTRLAARLCGEQGQLERSQQLWGLSWEQWRALGRTDDAREAALQAGATGEVPPVS